MDILSLSLLWIELSDTITSCFISTKQLMYYDILTLNNKLCQQTGVLTQNPSMGRSIGSRERYLLVHEWTDLELVNEVHSVKDSTRSEPVGCLPGVPGVSQCRRTRTQSV